jgi:arylsulfatase A-like enzyme
MSARFSHRLTPLLFLIFLSSSPATASAGATQKPNIILIIADDLGWGDLGCYGHPILKTPYLDRLAKQGILFTQYTTGGPICSPTRAALLTGRFPARCSLHNCLVDAHLGKPAINRKRKLANFLDPRFPTLARALQKNGYITGHFGKWHLGTLPLDRYGFSAAFNTDKVVTKGRFSKLADRPQSTKLIIGKALDFIKQNRRARFYAQICLKDVHAPLNPTEAQMRVYQNEETKKLPYRTAMQIYGASVTEMDLQIGRFIEKLEQLKLSENTLIIFTSDNGPADIASTKAGYSGVGSAGPFRGKKGSLYEGGLRVPFILRWPAGSPSGKVNASTLSSVDLFPTLCKISGTPVPKTAELDGEEMSDVFFGKTVERTKPLFWEWRFSGVGHVINHSPVLAVRNGDWKLLMNPDGSRLELYNIPQGPSEVDNVADTHPDIAKKLSHELLGWYQKLPVKGSLQKRAGSNDYAWPKE